MSVRVEHGDCLKIVPTLEPDTIDAIVCDPPYHLQSIVKRFAKTGRTDKTRSKSGPHQRTASGFMNKTWDGGDVAFRIETWEEMYRVLKPGAYIVAFSSTRTFGRMSVAIEDAGFITHPFLAWIFGQGFPKAHRIHDEAWDGWRYGTQSLKPAIEPIYVGQKPFERGLTGTENVRKWGTGALNIDGCRVGIGDDRTEGGGPGANRQSEGWRMTNGAPRPEGGRWPANVIHDGSEEVLAAFPDAGGQQAAVNGRESSAKTNNIYGAFDGRPATEPRGDSGSAARFFYSSKADSEDRFGSKHPTVKPIDLIAYLCRLVTPPGGLVLDPFAGSGTTGAACLREGFDCILIEREAEYIPDIMARIELASADGRHPAVIKHRNVDPAKARGEDLPMFQAPNGEAA